MSDILADMRRLVVVGFRIEKVTTCWEAGGDLPDFSEVLSYANR